ncbi:MAG: acetoacetate decarboxylase family protein [Eudoraea sp.]|nr:acetoacetate decarboxylase family protein [Eudoraea sp.]
MSTSDFFNEIEHTPVSWRDYLLHVPVFYQDISFMSVSLLASMEGLKNILPSKRCKPYRITPWHGAISLTAYQYRESDIDPYNEFSISVPVTIDDETPLFTGTLRKMPKSPLVYSHHLPVTTEIARVVGAEFAGYPKFIADIKFTEDDNWLNCELIADNQVVLTVSGRKLRLRRVPRSRVSPITHRRGYLLRSEFVISERDMGSSTSAADVQIEFGDHPIAREMKEIKPSRVLGYSYCPSAQGILTPVFESFKV